MWRQPRVSALETLAPRSVADRQVLYALIREALGARFPMRSEAVARMSLLAVRYLAGDGPRVLIRGPSGSGGGALVRNLAEILDVPFLEIDASSLAETNWSGVDLPKFLQQLRADLALRYPHSMVPELSERACILVSNLDRARLATSYGTSSTREHREGKQAALAQLLRGRPVAVAPDRGAGFIWKGGRALVVVTAEISDLRAGMPSSADLQSWGMLRDLADAIASGVFISVDAPSTYEIEHRLRNHLRELAEQFLQWGYHLRVEEQVIRYVLNMVVGGLYGGGAAAGASWISAAVEAALIRLLESGARSGTVWVLARDDLSLPDPPKGVWRE